MSKLNVFTSLLGKNRRLVTDEPVQFEEEPVEVQDFRRITNHFRGIYGIYLKCIKQNWKMSTCNRLDVESLQSWPTMPKNFPALLQTLGGRLWYAIQDSFLKLFIRCIFIKSSLRFKSWKVLCGPITKWGNLSEPFTAQCAVYVHSRSVWSKTKT